MDSVLQPHATGREGLSRKAVVGRIKVSARQTLPLGGGKAQQKRRCVCTEQMIISETASILGAGFVDTSATDWLN